MLKVYHYNSDGVRNLCGKTKNPSKWLKENNKKRYEDVVCCEEGGYLDDDGNDVNGKEAHEQKKCSCIELINEFSFEWIRDVE